LLLLVGIPLPYLFNNRFVFNLHLIRAAGLGQALATVVIALAGVRLLLNKEELAMRTLGAAALLALALLHVRVIGMIVMIASMLLAFTREGVVTHFEGLGVFRRISAWRGTLALLCVGVFVFALFSPVPPYPFILIKAGKLALFLGILGLLVFSHYRHMAVGSVVVLLLLCYTVAFTGYQVKSFKKEELAEQNMPMNQSWEEMISWIRSSDLRGPFLLPMDDNGHTDYFQMQARRKIWVDFKQGAAVMWSPSFYYQWSTRYYEVAALHTPEEMVLYAKSHGIRYVLLHVPDENVSLSCELLKRTPFYVLYEVR
jgi:hypothetical protein